MLGAAAVFVAAAMTPMGGGLALPPPSIWPAILFTAVFASALGFFVQAWAQGKLPATPAAIVLLTEPAWAAFFGVLLSGNPFPPIRIIGAGLLLATPIVMTLAESRAGRRILIYVRGERGEPAAA
jgi:drug/metabolite transporter (DMT)-like permease